MAPEDEDDRPPGRRETTGRPALPDYGDFTATIDGKQVLIVPRLAEWFRAEAHVRLGEDGKLWGYCDGHYVPSDGWVKASVRSVLGDKFYSKTLGEVLAYLRAEVPAVEEAPEHLIAVRNGLVEWRTGKLLPHSPELFTISQSPARWDPQATCPTIDRFLGEVLPEDAIDLIWEIIGYGLYNRRPIQKAVLLSGAGGTGKSKLLAVLRGLLGEESYSTQSLQSLAENRFAVVSLYAKKANICGDLDARAVTKSDLFKQIVGGDSLTMERKHRDAFNYKPRALLVFSANDPPTTADQSAAWFDRWMLVPMGNVFRGTEGEDTGLEERLLAEIDGALVKAVAGLQRLMVRGRFEQPLSVQMAAADYQSGLDTVVGFVAEQCHVGPDLRVDKTLLYREYRRWCADSGRLPVSAQRFNRRVVGLVPNATEMRSNGRRWMTCVALAA